MKITNLTRDDLSSLWSLVLSEYYFIKNKHPEWCDGFAKDFEINDDKSLYFYELTSLKEKLEFDLENWEDLND